MVAKRRRAVRKRNLPRRYSPVQSELSTIKANAIIRLHEYEIAYPKPYIGTAPPPPPEVSFVKLKEMAKELLPADSNLRMLILAESDIIDGKEAITKVEIYIKLLYKEFKKY